MNYDKLVTRIAKAIHKAESGTQCTPWKAESKGVQNAFRDEAVVAVKVFAKECNKEMFIHGTFHEFLLGEGGANYPQPQ